MRLALALLLAASPALAELPTVAVLSGVATHAKDGDGVVFGGRLSRGRMVGGVEVRLQGVAAPEDRQGAPRTPEGRAATAALDAMVRGRLVVCALDGSTASGGRSVAVCRVDGLDVGGEMVGLGLALPCRAFAGDRYDDEEAEAVAAGSRLAEVYEAPDYCREP